MSAVETGRFDVRPYSNGGSERRFEVFDRMTGATVASALRRPEAEADAQRRNSGERGVPPPMTLGLAPEEISALRLALEGYLSLDVGGRDHHILEDLYSLFVSWERRRRG